MAEYNGTLIDVGEYRKERENYRKNTEGKIKREPKTVNYVPGDKDVQRTVKLNLFQTQSLLWKADKEKLL